MIYADTDVLTSLVCPDVLSAAAERWYAGVSEPVMTSHWSTIEFRSNIGLRIRKKQLTRASGLSSMAAFDNLLASALHLVSPSAGHFVKARDWLAHPECALRSGDALHLAIAFGSGCHQLVTFDQPLTASARKLKLPVLLLKA